MSDDEPASIEPVTAIAVKPIAAQARRLRRLLTYLSSDKPDWRRAIGPALSQIDVMQWNLEQIRKAILELETQGKDE